MAVEYSDQTPSFEAFFGKQLYISPGDLEPLYEDEKGTRRLGGAHSLVSSIKNPEKYGYPAPALLKEFSLDEPSESQRRNFAQNGYVLEKARGFRQRVPRLFDKGWLVSGKPAVVEELMAGVLGFDFYYWLRTQGPEKRIGVYAQMANLAYNLFYDHGIAYLDPQTRSFGVRDPEDLGLILMVDFSVCYVEGSPFNPEAYTGPLGTSDPSLRPGIARSRALADSLEKYGDFILKTEESESELFNGELLGLDDFVTVIKGFRLSTEEDKPKDFNDFMIELQKLRGG